MIFFLYFNIIFSYLGSTKHKYLIIRNNFPAPSEIWNSLLIFKPFSLTILIFLNRICPLWKKQYFIWDKGKILLLLHLKLLQNHNANFLYLSLFFLYSHFNIISYVCITQFKNMKNKRYLPIMRLYTPFL